jgi:hypothetical protein
MHTCTHSMNFTEFALCTNAFIYLFFLQVSFHAQLQRYSREQTQIKTTSTMSPCHISRSTWSRCKKRTHKCLQIFTNACFIMWTHLKFHIAKIWRHGWVFVEQQQQQPEERLIRDIKLEIKKKIIKSRKLHKKKSSVSHIHSLFE